MKFPYRDLPAEPCPAFPDQKKISIPAIRVTLRCQSKLCDVYALVDSGAEKCIFPSEIGRALGLDVKSGKKGPIRGIDDIENTAYYHEIEVVIGGRTLKILVGFMEKIPLPILGHDGFFDKFEIKFDYRKRVVELKPYQD